MSKIILKSIQLNNFMCHENFKIEFKKQITCIGGVNGSGKSAIMLALGVMFGHRASSMERGNSFKCLVRNGVNEAVITIEINNYKNISSHFHKKNNHNSENNTNSLVSTNALLNQLLIKNKEDGNEDAIEIKEESNSSVNSKLDENSTIMNDTALSNYGEVILIKKHLFVNENKTKLKVKIDGKFRTLEKQEMDFIISEYSLNLLNPLNFLTQENSKKILNVKKPQDLYNFFYVGTDFKMLDDEIRKGELKSEEMGEKLKDIKHKLDKVNRRLSLVKKNLNFLNNDFKGDLNNLIFEEKWLKIKELNKELEKHRNDLYSIVLEMEEKKNEIILKKNENKNNSEYLKVLKDIEKQIEKIKEIIEEKELEYKKIDLEYKEICECYELRKKQLENTKKLNNKEEIQNNLNNLEKENFILQEKLKNVLDEHFVVDKKVFTENHENNRINEKCEVIKSKLRDIEKNDQFDKLEDQMRKINSKIISQKHLFKEKVIGPIFNFISIKKEEQKWYKSVNLCISKSLNNFIVFNNEDKNNLTVIFKSLNVKYPICILPSKVPYSNIMENKQHKTILSILNINEPILINVLITYHSVERVILIEDRENAYKIINNTKRDNFGNIDCAYILSGDRIKLVNGNLNDTRDRMGNFYYFEDSKSRENDLKNKLKDLKTSYEYKNKKRELENSRWKINNDVTEIIKNIELTKSELESYNLINDDNYEKIKRKMYIISMQMKNMKNKKDLISKELEDFLNEKNNLLTKNKQIILESNNISEEKKLLLNKIEIKLKILNDKVRVLENLIRKFEREIEEVKNISSEYFLPSHLKIAPSLSQQTTNNQLNSQEMICITKEGSITKERSIKNDVEDSQRNIPSFSKSDNFSLRESQSQYKSQFKFSNLNTSEQILKINPRCLKDIENDRIFIKQKIIEAKELEDKEVLLKNEENLILEKNKFTSLINKFDSILELTITSIKNRKVKRDDIIFKKTKESEKTFLNLTRKNGYEGELIFDHKNMRLDLGMKVHNSEIIGNKSTLSGGERSFASVCFLLSLWKSFSCPLKVLDEFDVFMDPLNRRSAILALFDFIKNESIQLILITPLNLNDLVDDICDIKCLKKIDIAK